MVKIRENLGKNPPKSGRSSFEPAQPRCEDQNPPTPPYIKKINTKGLGSWCIPTRKKFKGSVAKVLFNEKT